MTPDPLTMQELRDLKQQYRHAGPQSNVNRVLATIDARDEWIRWLVEFHALEGSLTVLAANPTGGLPEEANKAAAALEIVAAKP